MLEDDEVDEYDRMELECHEANEYVEAEHEGGVDGVDSMLKHGEGGERIVYRACDAMTTLTKCCVDCRQ